MFVTPVAVQTTATKARSIVVDAWDNLIPSHGTNFANWEVSGGTSALSSSGITLDGIAGNYARIKIPRATVGTTYWAMIRWDSRSASAGNIQVVGNGGGNGSVWGDSTGAAFTVSTPQWHSTNIPNYGERYFKIKCYGNGASDYLVLSHTGSSSGQTIRLSEVKIFPEKTYHFRVLGRGDQFGSVQGTTSAGIAKRNMDACAAVAAEVVLHDGDSCESGNIAPSTWNQSVKDAAAWGMMCAYGNHEAAYANDTDWRSFYGYPANSNDDNRRFPPSSSNQYFHAFTLDIYNTLYKIGETRGDAMLANVQNSDAKWKVFVGHYPTITSGTNQSQDGFLRSSQGWNWSTNKVVVVLNGHNHQVERNMADSIVYYNIGKGGCDTHGWSTIESTSKLRIGGSGTTGYAGTLPVSGATAATGTGYLLLSVSQDVVIMEYWITENENFIDPWTGAAPAITQTDPSTHWLVDRVKFEYQ